MTYPIWKHHAQHGEILVRSKEELAALGEGWGDDSSVWRSHLLEVEAVEVKEMEEKVEEIAKENKKAAKSKVIKQG